MMLRPPLRNETWRVLAYTLAVALAFVAVGRLQFALLDSPLALRLLDRAGLLDRASDAALLDEAARVAERSRDALPRLAPGHRLAAVRLGYELGYASQLVGSFALSAPEVQAQARRIGELHVTAARGQARLLGLESVDALPVRSLRDFTELNQRFEADENGLARRLREDVSPLHEQLYLLGVHLGAESARVEWTGGRHALPPTALIRRHATLAGIDPALWRPLAAPPAPGEAPAQVVERYRGALQALGDALAADAAAGAAPAPRRPPAD